MARGRWLPFAALGVGSFAAAVTALVLEASVPEAPASVGASAHLGTPVLSARRLPTVLAEPVAERRLHDDLDAWASAAEETRCAVVLGPDAGTAFAAAADAPLVPASTQKLLTASAVLLDLGADAALRTTVVASAPPTDGIVAGDLTLIGGGDPLLASPDYVSRFERQPQIFTNLDELAANVQAAGVQRVTGSVVGDERRFDTLRSVPGWPQRYLDQQTVGPLSALTVNDGFESYPVPSDGRPLVSATDPAANAAAVLTALLEARGIEVVGDPRSGAAPPDSTELAAIEAPIGEVVRQMLTESDNLTAETLVKELGARAGDPSTAGGVTRTRALLEEAGFDLAAATLRDGSGLSLDNRVTCALLVALLTDADLGPALLERLPVAGETGTLTDRFGGTALQGLLQAKTGSLATVTALAGAVTDDDPPLTFAYLVNVAPPALVPGSVYSQQQALGEILLSWPRVADAEALGPLPLVVP